MKNILRSVLFFLLISLFNLPVCSFAGVAKLADVRRDIVFPDLTEEEKLVLAEQAQIFIKDLYAHRLQKMEYYGVEDPVVSIEAVLNNIASLSTAELEESLYRIFTAQRDLHMNYNFPSPYKNYSSFLPLTFIRSNGYFDDDGDGSLSQVRISAVNEEYFKQFAPNQRVPQIGDRVIGYDNLPIIDAIERELATSMGANEYGGIARSLQKMAFISHRRYLVPENDEVTITLLPADRELSAFAYTITLPWIAEFPDAKMRMLDIMSEDDMKVKPTSKPVYKPERIDLGEDLEQKEYNAFLKNHGLEAPTVYPDNPTNEPELTWGLIENHHGTFGYLKLHSFVPKLGQDFAISEIRRIILENFTDTKGLIFDVRNNGGGSITFADKLSQLFMPTETKVLGYRLLNNDLNYQILHETLLGAWSPQWIPLIDEVAGTDRFFTDAVGFASVEDANAIGQVYYKPVALLMNAKSYSATDQFSCALKDNNAGLLYGEDPTTGGGGANVIKHSLFNYVLPSVFKALPGDHAMRVSWRQNLRLGDNELIEDYGCPADIDVQLSKSDVITGGERQLRKITRSLAMQSHSYRYQSYVKGAPINHSLYLAQGNLTFGVYVKNTMYVKVLINDELHERIPVFAFGREKYVEIDLPDSIPASEVTNVTVIGNNFSDRNLWRLKRQVTVLEDKVVIDDSGFDIDFATVDTIAPVNVLNLNPAKDGWNLVSPYLQIGHNPNYKDNVTSSAVLFLNLEGRASAQLSFDMAFDTEADWDFITVTVSNNSREAVLFQGSGSQSMATFDFDLSEFAGQDNVLVNFRFTSDTNTTAPGVQLSKISIR